MEHHFRADIAKEYGINAAILLNNIAFWIYKNRSENRHLHDGRYWTYASKAGLTKQFPYLSTKQITYALDKLVDAEVLMVGDYNNSPLNHTKWYALTDKGIELTSPELTKGNNRIDKREQSISTFCTPELTKGNNRIVQKGNILDIYNNIYNNNTDINHTDNKKIYSTSGVLDKDFQGFTIDDNLRRALTEFANMRKAIKKPLTHHALELCIKKLFEMSDDEAERVAIVEQSVMNNWQGFYPLKGSTKNDSATTVMTPTKDVEDIERLFMKAYDGEM